LRRCRVHFGVWSCSSFVCVTDADTLEIIPARNINFTIES
jgi:hypothetical protein